MDIEKELEELADLLQKMPEIDRDVIVMTYYHKKDEEAIAKDMSITTDEVHAVKERALDWIENEYLRQPACA